MRLVGTGGMARVYEATDPDGARVAVKVLDATLDGEARTRFQREFDAVRRLDHPHIVRVRQAGVDGAWAWLSMDFVAGRDLDAVIADLDGQPGSARDAVAERVVRELCAALDHVHRHGLVHRDVKPANVLIDESGHARLTDFGVVKSDAATSTITMAGRLVGTIAYMAPELIADEAPDARADLYGVGAILYTLLTGRRPVEGHSIIAYLARHLTEPPVPPHELRPDVPPRLEAVCLRLLEKDRTRRFPSAAAVLRALDDRGEGDAVEVQGRAALLARWMSALDAVRRGEGGVLAIVGDEGSGRSTLVRHLMREARVQDLPTTDTGSGPRVVAIDDVDGDGGQLARAEVLAARARAEPLRLLVTTSDLRLAAQLAGSEEPFVLEPLDARGATALLRTEGLPASAAAALGQRVAGTELAWPRVLVGLRHALVRDGWLQPAEQGLVLRRAVADLRTAPLPAPAAVRERLLASFDRAPEEEQEVLGLMALLGRPAASGLLGRASSRPARLPVAIDRLVSSAWIIATEDAQDVAFAFVHPCAARVVADAMDASLRRTLHGRLADALPRRRRHLTAEAARHLIAAGRAEEGVPALLVAARHALRAGLASEASDAATTALEAAGDVLTYDEQATALQVRAGAAAASRRWEAALADLHAASALPQSNLPDGILSSDLGRVLHRLERFDEARPPLQAAVDAIEPSHPAWARAARGLADVALQEGALDEAGELVGRLLRAAVAADDPDAEARARRGLAHVLGLRGDLDGAAAELDAADELLARGGDIRVRAGILLRSVELELVAGRVDFAVHRAEALLDLVTAHDVQPRFVVAHALAAAARWLAGEVEEAVGLAQRAVQFAASRALWEAEGVLRAVRVLVAAGRASDAEVGRLDGAVWPQAPLHAPLTQALALRARARAAQRPDAARADLEAALARPPARWQASRVAALLDAGWAWVGLNDAPRALAAVAEARALLPAQRADGAQLALDAVAAAAGDVDAVAAGQARVSALLASLSPRVRERVVASPWMRPWAEGIAPSDLGADRDRG